MVATVYLYNIGRILNWRRENGQKQYGRQNYGFKKLAGLSGYFL
jgi:hypothetical protein